MLALFGLDWWRFLNTKDPMEILLFQEVGKRVQKYREIEKHNLAVEIANQVGKLFK